MTYWQSVLSRLLNPGILLIIVGAVLVYGSKKFTALVKKKTGGEDDRINMTFKIVGTVLAMAGAVLMLMKI